MVDRIHVLRPIVYDNVRRNEVSAKIPKPNPVTAMRDKPLYFLVDDGGSRQQRAATLLRNVEYHRGPFRTDRQGRTGRTTRASIWTSSTTARTGQFFHQPCLGCREFPASFELLEGDVPPSCYAGEKRELGYMLLDIDFERDMTPLFFKAVMQDGVVAPPSRLSPEVRA